MKNLIALFLCGVSIMTFGQPRDLTPTKRGQGFGSRDFRNLSLTGIQFQLGATYLMTRKTNKTGAFNNGTNGSYSIDPTGKFGGYAEIGMVHFPKKRSKLSLWLKTVLVSYYDWGLGFKYFSGKEALTINRLSPSGVVLGSSITEGNYKSGFLYGRFSLHKNVHIKGVKNFFFDNSFGVNFDYNLLPDKNKDGDPDHIAALVSVGATERYHSPFVAQLHYGLGIGIRLKRGAYLIPGVRVPVLGMNDWHKGNPSFKWFSRSYWPILFHVKYMFMLEKKAKNCPAVETNDQDKETQRNR